MGTTFAGCYHPRTGAPSSVSFDRALSQVSASVQPIEYPCESQPACADLAMCARPFGGGEADHRLSTGQMVVQFLWLTLQKQVIFRIADQRGTTDRFGKPALQVVIQHFGDEFAGRLRTHRPHAVRMGPARRWRCLHLPFQQRIDPRRLLRLQGCHEHLPFFRRNGIPEWRRKIIDAALAISAASRFSKAAARGAR
jgi:hypothetical protein